MQQSCPSVFLKNGKSRFKGIANFVGLDG